MGGGVYDVTDFKLSSINMRLIRFQLEMSETLQIQ